MGFERQTKRKMVNGNEYIDKGDYFEVTVRNSDLKYKVDKEYVDWMKGLNWHSREQHQGKYFYLASNITEDSKNMSIKYHIEIMKSEIEDFKNNNPYYNKLIIVDHINGDVTDNRKLNLRVRTQSENNMNKTIQSNNTSGFVGVQWEKRKKMWISTISYKEENIYLGTFYYLRNALRIRIEAEEEFFGEHAYRYRDVEYSNKIKEVLSLPIKEEPVIISDSYTSKDTGIIGISLKTNGRYVANLKGNRKVFKTLDEAIAHREKMWKGEYGDRPLLLTKDKKEKLI